MPAEILKNHVKEQYEDFIDLYIRSQSSADQFLDRWEWYCEEEEIQFNALILEALIKKAEDMGEVEIGYFFIGLRGQ